MKEDFVKFLAIAFLSGSIFILGYWIGTESRVVEEKKQRKPGIISMVTDPVNPDIVVIRIDKEEICKFNYKEQQD